MQFRYRGRIMWRVNDNCVEIDLATWHQRRMIRTHYDWSAQGSDVPVTAVRRPALELVRAFLRKLRRADLDRPRRGR